MTAIHVHVQKGGNAKEEESLTHSLQKSSWANVRSFVSRTRNNLSVNYSLSFSRFLLCVYYNMIPLSGILVPLPFQGK